MTFREHSGSLPAVLALSLCGTPAGGIPMAWSVRTRGRSSPGCRVSGTWWSNIRAWSGPSPPARRAG